jgi:hypothetical protein
MSLTTPVPVSAIVDLPDRKVAATRRTLRFAHGVMAADALRLAVAYVAAEGDDEHMVSIMPPQRPPTVRLTDCACCGGRDRRRVMACS